MQVIVRHVSVLLLLVSFAQAQSPQPYCTAGTSTNGCTPSINANVQPNTANSAGCVITTSGVEGQKLGIVFYSVDNTGFTPAPWGVGSTSLRCVKPPTKRIGAALDSGGAAGQCNGSYVINWDAFQAANPTALGNPWIAGDKVFVQSWYRDPSAVKTSNLSNALELTLATPGEVVVKDHTDPSLWASNPPGYSFGHYDNGIVGGTDFVFGAAAFQGNGGVVKSVGGLFIKGLSSNPNTGSWLNAQFNFIFYQDSAAFVASPAVGSQSYMLPSPTNAGWNTPIGMWNGFEVFYFEFDVEFLSIPTSVGATHLATVVPVGIATGSIGMGLPGILFSTGGGAAIGMDLDWFRSEFANLGPLPFQSIPQAPAHRGAFRVTTREP